MSEIVPEDEPLAEAVNPLGNMDLGGLLASAQQMMKDLQSAGAETVTGPAGGGAGSIVVNGHFAFESVSISAAAVDPDDPSLLEDLVLAALRDAADQLRSRQAGAFGGLDLGLGAPTDGLGFTEPQ